MQFQIISSRDKGESFAETEKKDFISASVNNNDQSKTIPDKKHIWVHWVPIIENRFVE